MSVYTLGTIRDFRANLADALNRAMTQGRVLIKRGDTTFELRVYTPAAIECTRHEGDIIRVPLESEST